MADTPNSSRIWNIILGGLMVALLLMMVRHFDGHPAKVEQRVNRNVERLDKAMDRIGVLERQQAINEAHHMLERSLKELQEHRRQSERQ